MFCDAQSTPTKYYLYLAWVNAKRCVLICLCHFKSIECTNIHYLEFKKRKKNTTKQTTATHNTCKHSLR